MEGKSKILIVDDEYSFCKNLKKFLDKKGCDTLFTTSGDHALDLIKDEKPDLITLDIRMPGINGYEVLEDLKFTKGKMKVIVISAIDVPDMEDSLMRKGADAVLNKPVDLNKLLEAIQKLTSQH